MFKAGLVAAFTIVFVVPGPNSVQHEVYRRSITVADPSATQAYFVVPPDVFLQSRADLGDLRITENGANGVVEVPYFVKVAQAERTDIDAAPGIETIGRMTTANFLVSERYPVAALRFMVEPRQASFDREVTIFGNDRTIASFHLRRTTVNRHGQSVVTEDDHAVFPATAANRYRAEIDNGDDPHLPVRGARLQIIQRRIYFDPKGAGSMTLYYGDDKTTAPNYDYARLTAADQRAAPASVTQEENNPEFQPRPDLRPWSEKRPVLLKAVLALVVFVLGALALLSMKTRDED